MLHDNSISRDTTYQWRVCTMHWYKMCAWMNRHSTVIHCRTVIHRQRYSKSQPSAWLQCACDRPVVRPNMAQCHMWVIPNKRSWQATAVVWVYMSTLTTSNGQQNRTDEEWPSTVATDNAKLDERHCPVDRHWGGSMGGRILDTGGRSAVEHSRHEQDSLINTAY